MLPQLCLGLRMNVLFLILMGAVTILVGPFIPSAPSIIVTVRFSFMVKVIAIGQKLVAYGGLKFSRGCYSQVFFVMFIAWLELGTVAS